MRSSARAVWRGLPFDVTSKSGAVGRRLVIEEYPLRDTPSAEDLGRKARRFSISGHIVGDDYAQRRDAILAASERAGSGTLIHPDFGRITVVCESLDYSESLDGGIGLVDLSFVFLEAGELRFPTGAPAAVGLLASAADALKAGAMADFLAVFDVSGAAFLVAAAVSKFEALVDTIEDATRGPLATLEDAYATAAEIEELAAAAEDLVLDVEELASRVISLYESLDLGSLLGILGSGMAVPITVTAAASEVETQARTNTAALTRFFSRGMLAEIGSRAELAASTLSSLDDAEALVSGYATSCGVEELDEVSTSPETHAALVDLRTSFSEAVYEGTSELSRLEDLLVPAPIPAIVLAFQLYGDPTREAEIVERNRILCPLFTAGELRVLSS